MGFGPRLFCPLDLFFVFVPSLSNQDCKGFPVFHAFQLPTRDYTPRILPTSAALSGRVSNNPEVGSDQHIEFMEQVLSEVATRKQDLDEWGQVQGGLEHKALQEMFSYSHLFYLVEPNTRGEPDKVHIIYMFIFKTQICKLTFWLCPI